MSIRPLLAASLLLTLAGCGGDTQREVRLLAPAGVVEDVARFEDTTGCRVDLRVYDQEENISAIARRRDTDVIAGTTPPGGVAHVSEAMARVRLRGGVVLTIPQSLSGAFRALEIQPAGRRKLSWTVREAGENDDCARRWVAYATSQ